MILVVLGPTATGKSAVALHLARHLRGEVLNADAFQVYRGLDIGTGKLTEHERLGVPHHLLDIHPLNRQFTAGDFVLLARSAIRSIREAGHLPVVAGGTGFYIRSLLKGLAPMPRTDPRTKETLHRLGERLGWRRLHDWLAILDPAYRSAIEPTDRQRIERALEVTLMTGRPFSSSFGGETERVDLLPSIKIGLDVPREILKERIRTRVEAMVAAGWKEEVEALLAGGASPDWPSFNAIGYRTMAEHIRGECTIDEAIDAVTRATARFAKR